MMQAPPIPPYWASRIGELTPLLNGIAAAKTVSELRAILSANPQLYETDLDPALTWLLNRCWARGERIDTYYLLATRDFLERCRQRGIERALATITQLPLAATSPIVEIAATDPKDLPRWITLLRRVQAELRRQDDPAPWALFTRMLAVSLCFAPGDGRMERVEEALSLYESALQALPPDIDLGTRASYLTSKANAYVLRLKGGRRENLAEAGRLYEQALGLLSPDQHPYEWARTHYNFAVAWFQMPTDRRESTLREARKHALHAHSVFSQDTRNYLRDFVLVQQLLGNIACQPEASDPQGAIKAYEQALAVLAKNDEPDVWATLKSNLANAYADYRTGNPEANRDRAIALYREALTVRTPEASPERWAETMNNLGTVYSERRSGPPVENRRRAIECLQQALTVYSPTSFASHARGAACNLGQIYLASRDWACAAHWLGQAVAAHQQLYRAAISGQSRHSELAEAQELHLMWAYALARAGQLQKAAVALEQGRARRLNEALQRDHADLANIKSLAPELYTRYQAAAARLRRAEAEERGLIVSPAEIRDGEPGMFDASVTLQDETADATAEIETVIGEIRQIKGFTRFLAEPGWEDIVAALRPSQALVYLGASSVGGLALVVSERRRPCLGQARQAQIEAVWEVRFSAEDLDQLLGSSGYAQGQVSGGTGVNDALRQGLPLLGERLIGPVAALLRSRKFTGVVLVPGGRLGLLPLHAASYQVAGRASCLLDEFDVAYAPAARVLAANQSAAQARASAALHLVGVSDPQLRFAPAELRTLAKLLQPKTATVTATVIDSSQYVRTRLDETLPRATHVHFACHGRFVSSEPLGSCLQLTGNNLLTLRDILGPYRERLAKVRLAVLSACQTAITDASRVPDESIGLLAGFLQAGVPAVVGTLWSVDDKSTAVLMLRFYELYLGRDGRTALAPARALREAQRWLRDASAEEIQKRLNSLAEATSTPEGSPTDGRNLLPVGAHVRPPSQTDTPAAADSAHFAAPYHWAGYVYYGAL